MTKTEIKQMLTTWENSDLIFYHFSSHTADLHPLSELVFDDSDARNWRAAWVLDQVNDRNPALLKPFLERITDEAFKTRNLSKLRHYLKIISLHPISTARAGELFDKALTIFGNPEIPIAPRVHAMQILFEISELEPELKPELVDIIENELEIHPSAGLKSRGSRLLKKLRQADSR